MEESMKDFEEQINGAFRKVKEGDVLTGTVIGVSDTEVTVDLAMYTGGIIPADEISDDPSFKFKEEINVGDEITATVIRTEGPSGNLVLSRKTANAVEAWETLKEKKDSAQILNLKVSAVVNGGVIVYVDGMRGFIPASKLSLNYVEDLNEWLNKDVQAQIITVDPEDKKLVLSCKEILVKKRDEDRAMKISNLRAGMITEGIVEDIKEYGAFVNIGEGLTGLLHISQISDKKIRTVESVLKKGDKVTVKVTAVKDGKISLSMKAANEEMIEKVEEEMIEIPKAEEASTSLGSLLAGLKLN